MTRRVYTSRLSFPHGTDSRKRTFSTEVTQNRMAQRHHLSKALFVSLMKNHYSNKFFVGGKEDPSIWYEFNI